MRLGEGSRAGDEAEVVVVESVDEVGCVCPGEAVEMLCLPGLRWRRLASSPETSPEEERCEEGENRHSSCKYVDF